MALKSLITLGQPEQRLAIAVYTVTSPAVCCLFLLAGQLPWKALCNVTKAVVCTIKMVC